MARHIMDAHALLQAVDVSVANSSPPVLPGQVMAILRDVGVQIGERRVDIEKGTCAVVLTLEYEHRGPEYTYVWVTFITSDGLVVSDYWWVSERKQSPQPVYACFYEVLR